MKYIKLFENFNSLDNIKMNDVIGSVEDYIKNTYNDTYPYSPYGGESKSVLEDDIEMEDLWNEYNIDKNNPDYWKSDNFIKMMSDPNCYVSLPRRFNIVKNELNNKIKGNKINLYRCMSVDKEFIDNLLIGDIDNIGRYWSYSSEDIGALEGNVNNKYLIVIEAEVDMKYVNIKDTLLYNMNYDIGLTEREVILNNDAEFIIKNIYITNDVITNNEYRFPFYSDKLYRKVNIDSIKEKTFYI